MVDDAQKMFLSSITNTVCTLYWCMMCCISVILVVGATYLGDVVMMSLTVLLKNSACHFSMATYVAISDKSDDTVFLVYRYAQSQFSLAHMNDGLAQVHVFRNDRQVFLLHHVLGCGEQALAQLSTGVKLCKVAWFEVAYLHQRNG